MPWNLIGRIVWATIILALIIACASGNTYQGT